MKLRTYLAVATLTFSILGITTVGRLAFTTQSFRDSAASTSASVALLRSTSRLETALFDFARECLLSAITYPSDKGVLHTESAARLRAAVADLQGVSTDPEAGAAIVDLSLHIEGYIRRMERDGGVTPVNPSFGGAEHDLLRRLSALEALAVKRVEGDQEQIARMNRMTDLGGTLVVILFVAAGTVLLLVGRRMVYQPIVDLEQAISRAALDPAIRAREAGTVEIRKVAAVFNEMAAKLGKQREHQLRFLAAVAHDLRNPLNAIIMSMDLLAAGKTSSAEDRDELFGIIGRQVRNLDRLVGDLLYTARIEAGQLDLKVEWVDVVRVASESAALFRTLSPLHQVVFESETEGTLYCRGDVQRLGQVLNNILSNAIKYSPDGGEVRVKVELDGPDVLVSVTDRGVGIDAKDVHAIFMPFNRSPSTRDTIPGVGIGLSVSRRIVEAHGGAIEIDSAPGCGSTFRVRLPLGREVTRRKPLAAVPRDFKFLQPSAAGTARGADAGRYRAPGPGGA